LHHLFSHCDVAGFGISTEGLHNPIHIAEEAGNVGGI